MKNNLNNTKMALGIINIEYIVDNTYILHYINSELITITKINDYFMNK